MKTETKKPKVKLSGTDGNVFALLGLCTKALKNSGLNEQSKELTEKVWNSKSYEDALSIMSEYCQVS